MEATATSPKIVGFHGFGSHVVLGGAHPLSGCLAIEDDPLGRFFFVDMLSIGDSGDFLEETITVGIVPGTSGRLEISTNICCRSYC